MAHKVTESTNESTILTLPALIKASSKNRYGLILAASAFVSYVSSNHWHIREPVLLTMTPWDLAIPFLPLSIWIYLSEYLYFVVIYLSCKNIPNINRYFYAFLFQQLFAVTIFFIYPTIFPRDLYPLLDSHTDPWTYWAFVSLRASDTPANCCPSLHVSSVFLSNLLVLDDAHKKYFWAYFLWGSLIILSTLTTKQHYIVDLTTGLCLATLTYYFFSYKVRYH